MPFSRPLSALGDGGRLRFRATTRCCSTRRWRGSAGSALQDELRRRRDAGELVGAGLAIFVDKGGLGPADGTRVSVDTDRRGGIGDRRLQCRAGFRDGDGADLRRDAGGRLPPRAGRLRPDRPDRLRHRRACLARLGDDRRRDPCRDAETPRQGAGDGRRAAAGRARRARHRRRRRGASRSARRPLDHPRRDRAASGARLADPRRSRPRARAPKAGSAPRT